MSKRDVILQIYNQLASEDSPNFVFDNKLVKQTTGESFSNQFDLTKVDSSSRLPQELLNKDVFIIHLGKGKHRFVSGISNGYHRFETITDDEIVSWPYTQHTLNGLDTSEAGMLSLAFNQGIIQDFLFDDRNSAARVYIPRRTKHTFKFRIDDEEIEVTGLQIERDLVVEYEGNIAIFEAKNEARPSSLLDFNVFQLYNPYRYLDWLLSTKGKGYKSIKCVYAVQTRRGKKASYQLYEYTFEDKEQPASIKLIKKRRYNLDETIGELEHDEHPTS